MDTEELISPRMVASVMKRFYPTCYGIYESKYGGWYQILQCLKKEAGKDITLPYKTTTAIEQMDIEFNDIYIGMKPWHETGIYAPARGIFYDEGNFIISNSFEYVDGAFEEDDFFISNREKTYQATALEMLGFKLKCVYDYESWIIRYVMSSREKNVELILEPRNKYPLQVKYKGKNLYSYGNIDVLNGNIVSILCEKSNAFVVISEKGVLYRNLYSSDEEETP